MGGALRLERLLRLDRLRLQLRELRLLGLPVRLRLRRGGGVLGRRASIAAPTASVASRSHSGVFGVRSSAAPLDSDAATAAASDARCAASSALLHSASDGASDEAASRAARISSKRLRPFAIFLAFVLGVMAFAAPPGFAPPAVATATVIEIKPLNSRDYRIYENLH